MALWQLPLDPIPASSARVEGVEAIRLTREQLDAITFQLKSGEQALLLEELTHLLPEKRGWSPHMRIWGDEKSHDIQVYFDAGVIESIQFRLDASRPSIALIGGICELARTFGWVFASRDVKIVQPSSEAVARAVLQSDAGRFVNDPEAYISAAIEADRGETDDPPSGKITP